MSQSCGRRAARQGAGGRPSNSNKQEEGEIPSCAILTQSSNCDPEKCKNAKRIPIGLNSGARHIGIMTEAQLKKNNTACQKEDVIRELIKFTWSSAHWDIDLNKAPESRDSGGVSFRGWFAYMNGKDVFSQKTSVRRQILVKENISCQPVL